MFYGFEAKSHLVGARILGHDGLMTSATVEQQRRARTPRLLPGLVAAVGLAVVARQVSSFATISALTIAVILGIVLGNLPNGIEQLRPGLAFAGRNVLRFGVVLLGMRLSVGQIGTLGVPVIVVIVVTVAATFFGTQALGRRLGVSAPLSLLIATGYSICGASAIAAMESNSDAEEEEVALAIGLVTLDGTVAMFGLPALAGALDLTDDQFAIWAGASIHDVAQVVAAGATRGPTVLAVAVVVKLSRVLLLAPLVTGVSISRQRSATATDEASRPPLIPGFVVGFLTMVIARSSGLVPDPVIEMIGSAESFVFAIALVGLGAGVRVDRLRRVGGAPLLLGAFASITVAGVSLIAVLFV